MDEGRLARGDAQHREAARQVHTLLRRLGCRHSAGSGNSVGWVLLLLALLCKLLAHRCHRRRLPILVCQPIAQLGTLLAHALVSQQRLQRICQPLSRRLHRLLGGKPPPFLPAASGCRLGLALLEQGRRAVLRAAAQPCHSLRPLLLVKVQGADELRRPAAQRRCHCARAAVVQYGGAARQQQVMRHRLLQRHQPGQLSLSALLLQGALPLPLPLLFLQLPACLHQRLPARGEEHYAPPQQACRSQKHRRQQAWARQQAQQAHAAKVCADGSQCSPRCQWRCV